MNKEKINVIGGGLAGCEAALRIAKKGLPVTIWEMKPKVFSPAHVDENLAELVCSNSFRSDDPYSAVGLLKEELRSLGSVIMEVASKTAVAAGKALAVDRLKFSQLVTDIITQHPLIEIKREVVKDFFSFPNTTVLASGPLTYEPLAKKLAKLTSDSHLHFYDALAPIVTYDSLNMDKIYLADRYGTLGQGDYLNAPMEEDEFDLFVKNLKQADQTALRPFEDKSFFEGCLPIEVMASRGERTLTFGPLKPVGLENPKTGKRPYAVVQLRRENQAGTLWNLVGFQTRLTRPAQDKILKLIPGLENVEIARYGAIHRNTFINAPKTLDIYMRLKINKKIFIAGQLSGVEGYVESAAQGLLAGENAARQVLGEKLIIPPVTTALGGLVSHLMDQTKRKFQPSNINFGLLLPPQGRYTKKERASLIVEKARKDMAAFKQDINYEE